MDLVQRALTWGRVEPDLYVNFFFGFPFADVPDGMVPGDDQRQARPGAQGGGRHGDGLAAARGAALARPKVHSIPRVRLAGQAIAQGGRRRSCWPTISDRSGSATGS